MHHIVKRTKVFGILVGVLWAGAAMATTALPPLPKMSQNSYWKDIGQRLTYIQEGHQGPVIYDFFDPNCPYCHSMYDEEQSLIKAGQLTVRYVPVAYLMPSSTPEAAALLQSSDRVATLQHFEALAGKSFAAPMTASGPVGLPQAKATAPTIQALKTNMAILQTTHSMGVPAILYEHKNGSTGLIPGMVSHGELLTMLPNLK
ncbi:thioredoxin fold domain-containing protein [Acidithiobacillus ferrooxidans]|uniref:thioredoxin fold domain-containing protein n=1 Tax=Acidithiobacillus ferrooxidans TaxID=920 RepID=UPI001D00382B|nr:thioredoxin fold domain-containing protein [Acidithiobacillus ferrooxidans]